MPEPRILIAIDVVGSTEALERYGEQNGIRKVTAAIQRIELALKTVDNGLRRSFGIGGDAVLLLDGQEEVELYFAATDQQMLFYNRYYGRCPLKIALTHGIYEERKDAEGRVSYFGSDLNFLHRMIDYCPHMGVMVSPAFYGLMDDRGYGHRFIEVRETMRGIGNGAPQLFYESRGGYVIPPTSRQPADRRKQTGVPKKRWWQW